MTAAPIPTPRRLDCLAFRLVLMVLVAACGEQGALAQPVLSDSHRTIQRAQGGHPPLRDLKFAHLTTDDGLSHNTVVDILQDRRGFMWFATAEGLNRYDGHVFVVYKHNPTIPEASATTPSGI